MDSIPKMENTRYASVEEAGFAINRLEDLEIAKLVIIARYFVKTRLKGSVFDADDLLHDAIVKTLDGRRRWNKNVTMMKHLDRVMESDSGHIAEHDASFEEDAIDEYDDPPSDLFSDPRDRLDAKIEVDRILGIIGNDHVARDLLKLLAQGLQASDIEHEMKMDKIQYQTVRKRIRRRLMLHISLKGDDYHEYK